MKRLLLFLILILTLALSSCGQTGGGGGGEGGGGSDEDIIITEGGVSHFTLVYDHPAPASLTAELNKIVLRFREAGVTLQRVDAKDKAKISENEILIGNSLPNREGYEVDYRPLGCEGYSISVKERKIIIGGGSNAALIKGLDCLFGEILSIYEEGVDLKDIKIQAGLERTEKQDYSVKDITLDGKPLGGRGIALDLGCEISLAGANSLREALWEATGLWPELLPLSEKDSAGIILRVGDSAERKEFSVWLRGGKMYIDCPYPSLLSDCISGFISELLPKDIKKDPDFSEGVIYTEPISTIYYEDFGAVGDGVTDDFNAMKACHERASITGQTVAATPGRTYNVGEHAESIIITTNTVWDGATIIIDDSRLALNSKASKTDVFVIASTQSPITVTGLTSLSGGQKNIGISFSETVLLHLVNDNKKQYIRYGENANSGSSQQEVILVHPDGSVDPSTPIMWDYDEITSATAIPTDDEPVTLSGGTVITITNTMPKKSVYTKRGISIRRSNTTVRGLTHLLAGEGESGTPYSGFLEAVLCNNLLIEDVRATGHKAYVREGSTVTMGSYDLKATYSNGVTWKSVRQTNSITDKSFWGIMASNFSKNLTYDDCYLSRFDAHQGVYNATIKNSELGHQKISIIGAGTLTVERVIFNTNEVIKLRNDYGSTWDGEVIIKNITVKNTKEVTLIEGVWVNHYFGYECHLPKSITVEGVTLSESATVYLLSSFKTGMSSDSIGGQVNLNPMSLPEKITVSGVDCELLPSKNNSLLPEGIISRPEEE